MFKVNIAEILEETGRKKQIKETVDLKLEDDLYKVASPVQIDLTAENLGSEVLVTGTLKTKLLLRCVRCNELFEQEIVTEVEEEFKAEANLLQFNEEDQAVGLDEFRFIIDAKGNIDLEDVLTQEIILALPLKPICSNCHAAVNYSTINKDNNKVAPKAAEKAITKEIKKEASKEVKKLERALFGLMWDGKVDRVKRSVTALPPSLCLKQSLMVFALASVGESKKIDSFRE